MQNLNNAKKVRELPDQVGYYNRDIIGKLDVMEQEIKQIQYNATKPQQNQEHQMQSLRTELFLLELELEKDRYYLEQSKKLTESLEVAYKNSLLSEKEALESLLQYQIENEKLQQNLNEMIVTKNKEEQVKVASLNDTSNFLKEEITKLKEENHQITKIYEDGLVKEKGALESLLEQKDTVHRLEVELQQLKKENSILNKKYSALKNSKLGKLTLNYWQSRKRFLSK